MLLIALLMLAGEMFVLGAEEAPRIKPTIEGLEGELEDNVRAHLSLSGEPCSSPRWRIQRLFGGADQEIERALRALGYYHPSVSKALSQEKDCWQAAFRIDAGEPVQVTQMDIRIHGDAGDDDAFTGLLEKLPLKKGDVLHHGRYEDAKNAIASLAAERGYLDGRFRIHELRVEPDRNQARVRLDYDSGPRYRFGEIRLHQDALDPDLAQRFIKLREGDPYESRALRDLNRALTDSRYFSRVDVRPGLDEARGKRVPVDIELTARKPHALSAGAGFATDTGPKINLGYENRRLSPRGHRFSTEAGASFIHWEVKGDYEIPLEDPRSDWLAFQGGFKSLDTDSVDSETAKAAVRWTQRRASSWLETRFLEFSRESFQVGSEDDIAVLVVPGISFSQTLSDDLLVPRRGRRLHLELRGSHDELLSETSFLQLRGASKWIRSLGSRARLIARGELGFTMVDRFNELPASERFFAGGDNSVRGYGFQDLGPENAEGDVVGGRHLVVGSLEYEHLLAPKWATAAFVDTGNALNGLGDGVKTGAGIGLRWRSPVGPVRLDLAFPLDNADRSFRVHISMGPDL